MVEQEKTKNWTATVTSQEHSTVKIDGEIPYTALLEHRALALAELGKNTSIDGFRKGHIPEKVLLDHMGEMALLTEMAERALSLIYPEIIREHNIHALGHPQISITKIAKDNPLGFSALVAIVPKITLPDYKKIARGTKKSIGTSKEDVTVKHRAAITDSIIEMSTVDLPHILIDAEIGQMFGQMEQDLARANLSIDDYLSHIKKTKEELAAEWAPAAEKRAKLQLILNKIAEQEKITTPQDAVEREVTYLLEQYKDADETRVRLYVTSMLVNDEVLKMLEKESEQKN